MPVENLDELRVAVAVEVFGGPKERPGWWWFRGTGEADGYPDIDAPGQEPLYAGPHFESDWTALGSLLERMRERGFEWMIAYTERGQWEAGLALKRGGAGLAPGEVFIVETAPTLPEAAARAALEAIRAENGVAR